jgi:hypothetical protein
VKKKSPEHLVKIKKGSRVREEEGKKDNEKNGD